MDDQEKREQKDPGQADPAQAPADELRSEQLPEPNFQVFLAGLYAQTLMSLGEVENPVTTKRERNLAEAQYLIDTIDMLKDKAEGNLTEQEQHYVENLLHDLRIRYVNALNAGRPQHPQEASEPPAQQ